MEVITPTGFKPTFLLKAVKSLSIDYLLDRNSTPQAQQQNDATFYENTYNTFEDSYEDLYDESVSDDFHCHVLPERRSEEPIETNNPEYIGALDVCERQYADIYGY